MRANEITERLGQVPMDVLRVTPVLLKIVDLNDDTETMSVASSFALTDGMLVLRGTIAPKDGQANKKEPFPMKTDDLIPVCQNYSGSAIRLRIEGTDYVVTGIDLRKSGDGSLYLQVEPETKGASA